MHEKLKFLFLLVIVSAFVRPAFADIKCGDGGLIYCTALKRCMTTGDHAAACTSGPASTPFRCIDNVTKTVEYPSQCCPADSESSMTYCWDGSCVPSYRQCPKLQCTEDPSKNYTCPDTGICVSCPTECPRHTCPASSVVCWDSSCAESYDKCPCPPHNPYRCPATASSLGLIPGQCRSDIEHCPNATTLCPADKPVRCTDGTCQVQGKCIEPAECPATQVRCSDGVCRTNRAACDEYVQNGCHKDTPYLCEAGMCVATHQECPNPWVCRDAETPYKCLNGLCVDAPEHCPPLADSQGHCFKENMRTMCANGQCVEHFDVCPAIQPLSCGEVPAANLSKQCPDHLPYYCYEGDMFGSCVANQADCNLIGGCPSRYPHRCSDGLCVTGSAQCIDSATKLCNGCPSNKPNRCPNGLCKASEGECTLENGCPSSLPYLCPDGMCHQQLSECQNRTDTCPSNYPIRCQMGECVSSRGNCKSPDGCEFAGKFLCMDGTCVNEAKLCSPTIICPNATWHICANGQAVADLADCATMWNCPDATPYHCGQKVCAESADKCVYANCPTSAPIRCWNYGCVNNITQCPPRYGGGSYGDVYGGDYDRYYWSGNVTDIDYHGGRGTYEGIDYHLGGGGWLDGETGPTGGGWGGRGDGGVGACRGETPFNCYDGTCAKTPYECYATYNATCDYITCPDGSCVTSMDQCEAVQACPVIAPKRCWDGTCIAIEKECPTPLPGGEECEEGGIRCEDGVCREECAEINGCPLTHPVSCMDGTCSIDGESCTLECTGGQFKCFNGTCVDKFGQCDHPVPATIKTSCFTYGRNSSSVVDTDIVSAYDVNVTLGHVYIPPESFLSMTGIAADVSVCGLTDSEIFNVTGEMTGIISPVTHIELDGDVEFVRDPMEVSLMTPIDNMQPVESYCLARVANTTDDATNRTGNGFVCVDDNVTQDDDGNLVGRTTTAGILAFVEKSVAGPACQMPEPYQCPDFTCVTDFKDCPSEPFVPPVEPPDPTNPGGFAGRSSVGFLAIIVSCLFFF
ncbi:hypothetical protein PCE1_002874 [Barthelona sp. PCE]